MQKDLYNHHCISGTGVQEHDTDLRLAWTLMSGGGSDVVDTVGDSTRVVTVHRYSYMEGETFLHDTESVMVRSTHHLTQSCINKHQNQVQLHGGRNVPTRH
ncbi:hypothetical protein J6590_035887 [Homalodisca vitripennis]|nr:hypothetical protein J6590_035887 [Homalodisca vitripennis]